MLSTPLTDVCVYRHIVSVSNGPVNSSPNNVVLCRQDIAALYSRGAFLKSKKGAVLRGSYMGHALDCANFLHL